jgi:hypothetical protein
MAVFDRLRKKYGRGYEGTSLNQTQVEPVSGQGTQTDNPYQVIENKKSEGLSDKIRGIMEGVGGGQSTDRTLRNYENALNKGGAKNFANQEADYLSSYFDGTTESNLSSMRRDAGEALRRAGDLARQNARKDLKLSGFRSRGGASSRLDRMSLDRNIGIETDIANRMAQQRRADFDQLNRLRSGALGQRQNIYDRLAGRELMGEQARIGLLGQQAGLLGQLGAADRANTVYQLAESPEYTQQQQYQAALEAQGFNPMSVPGSGYAYDMNQTDPYARFPKAPYVGYGVNPVNGLYGYQYADPVNQYPKVLRQV